MYLSGSVGYTLLKQKSNTEIKYVLLLADIHDGVTYCEQDSTMIDQWLDSKDSNDILLEEAIRERLNLTDLWPSSAHTQRLKKLNETNYRIKPIDIRPMLLPFSWELAKMNTELSRMPLSQYINTLSNFFNLKKTTFFMNYIVPEVKKLAQYEKFRVSLMTHFYEMKELFNEFITTYQKYMNTSICDLYDSHQDILEIINNINSMIMEWYVLVLIHNSKKNTILHLGLAHSNRILDLLKDVYQFEVIKESGINRMKDINDVPNACILVPPHVSDIFRNKCTEDKCY